MKITYDSTGDNNNNNYNNPNNNNDDTNIIIIIIMLIMIIIITTRIKDNVQRKEQCLANTMGIVFPHSI